jgi:hypothetical protein
MTAGSPNPPNILDEGIAGGALGFFIVYLANAIAKILQTIITAATLGLQSTALGATASKVEVNN